MPSIFPVDFQKNAFSGTIAPEFNERINLFPIQAFEGVMQPSFRTDLRMGGERIIDMARPALLLKRIEYAFLIFSRPFESLDNYTVKSKLPPVPIPNGGWQIYRFLV